jgi:hypothetical protein
MSNKKQDKTTAANATGTTVCPVCGAEPRQGCIKLGGKNYGQQRGAPHEQRVSLFIRRSSN